MSRINAAQIRAMHAVSGKVFPNEETYRAWLEQNYGVSSCTKLSFGEAINALKALNAVAQQPKPEPRYYAAGKRGYAAFLTQDQATEITRLEDDLGWTGTDGLVSFIKRQTGKNKTVPMLTNPEATKVITGMRRVLADRGGNDAA